MVYLIDGHNLIGQLPDVSLADPDDEAKLVEKLRGFVVHTGKKVVVVFDHGLPGGKSRMSTSSVEVVFASQPGDADTIMIGRIAKARDPGQWIVVTNDQAVLNAAQARRMKCLRSREFAKLLAEAGSTPRTRARDQGEASDPHVPPHEVEAWLKVFGDGKGKRDK
jgi:hypothetical protein